MLITYNEFISSGMPTSDDISSYEVEAAINAVEEFYLKQRLTDEHYIDLSDNPLAGDNPILLNGGNIDTTHYAGLKKALYHMVFAYMLTDGYRLTRYSSVEKTSEFSKSVDPDDLNETARRHWNIGISFVQEVQRYYNLNPAEHNQNDMFELLLW